MSKRVRLCELCSSPKTLHSVRGLMCPDSNGGFKQDTKYVSPISLMQFNSKKCHIHVLEKLRSIEKHCGVRGKYSTKTRICFECLKVLRRAIRLSIRGSNIPGPIGSYGMQSSYRFADGQYLRRDRRSGQAPDAQRIK